MAPHGAPFWDEHHEHIFQTARTLGAETLEALETKAESDLAGAARASIQALAKAGLLAHVVPKAFGGAHDPVQVRSIIATREGVAYTSGLADALVALQGLAAFPVALAGTPEQQKAWLPKVANGTAIGAFAVTEPDAGSDVAAMTTRAAARPDGWEITGTKTFISNAGLADYYALFARTGEGAKGVSCFLVPATTKGIRVTPLRMLATHPVGQVEFQRVHVPKGARIGAEGEGLKIAYGTLDRMRPTVAAAACGLAARALDEAVARAKARKQFGHPIGENQGLRWRLADAATELEAARLLVYRAGWAKDQGAERITMEAAQAKLFATEAAQRIIDLALQVHGGSGTLHGAVVERLYREIRALRIYEGTSEILREIIGRVLVPAPDRARA